MRILCLRVGAKMSVGYLTGVTDVPFRRIALNFFEHDPHSLGKFGGKY